MTHLIFDIWNRRTHAHFRHIATDCAHFKLLCWFKVRFSQKRHPATCFPVYAHISVFPDAEQTCNLMTCFFGKRARKGISSSVEAV